MEGLQEGFSAFISGFARIFLVSIIIWMVGLVVILFREMFQAGEFHLRDYLHKVWKMLLTSFEFTAYGAVIVGPIMMMRAEEEGRLTYSMLTVAAVILSVIYLYIRKQTGGFKKNKQTE
ncbi:hypothetical protein [Laceyella putida]|uniref:DUF2178 domain-containing protein n=1 Tax=Laceyella putida TaxID=110101 RepID=A0ABW2RK82_9BACL